jgi:hypothetical protein
MSLLGEDKQRFNEVWGLDGEGEFTHEPPGPNFALGSTFSLAMYLREMRELLCKYDARSTDVIYAQPVGEKILAKELNGVHDIIDEEIDFFKANEASKTEIGKRLLFLLQCDLLPGQMSVILRNKESNEYFKSEYTTWNKKTLGWFILVSLNLACIFYVTIFAIQATPAQQQAWFKSFLLWLICDVIFTSTAMVLYQQIYLPMTIIDDLDSVKVSVIREMQLMALEEESEVTCLDTYLSPLTDVDIESATASNFNAADYLFVSTRLARMYPNVPESKLVRRFAVRVIFTLTSFE